VKVVRRHVQQIRGDLEIVRADIDQLCQARTMVNGVSEAVHQLDRIADGIQKSVMDTRMVPIGPLFGRFKRVIRDITRSNSKDIQLVIRGEKTELDKRMVDELGDPLIHMVRNSADHGIEAPAKRIAAGKPAQGTVTLDAFHRGNRVIIQVRDDGQGLDPQKIRAKAVSKGLISAADAERLTTQQTYQLIWEPGFSTAEKVTEISGRGMGMDIVRSKIEQLNGVVELDSQVGVGTTITIKLPLTMAILPSLLTVISDDVFAIPVESVVEIVRVGEDSLTTVHGLCTARIRGRVISVVELNALLQWPNDSLRSASSSNGERTLVIVGTDGHELGLAVDSLLGEEDVVIKSLAENYRNVPGLAGASILGDGRVSLILDVAALVALACRKTAGSECEVVN
jgi:two-component system, chemotaxis family, sensor kinase CheA